MSGHTKGPWSLNGHFNVTASGRGVATCGGWQDGKEGTFDENCANARLIAAAPEMLEALKALCSWITDEVEIDGCEVPAYHARLKAAQRAIAKAEGRS